MVTPILRSREYIRLSLVLATAVGLVLILVPVLMHFQTQVFWIMSWGLMCFTLGAWLLMLPRGPIVLRGDVVYIPVIGSKGLAVPVGRIANVTVENPSRLGKGYQVLVVELSSGERLEHITLSGAKIASEIGAKIAARKT